MIHQAILAVIRTVNSPCLLHMDQRCRSRQRSMSRRTAKKRPRQQQIQGTAWALCAQITVDELHAGSDWLMAGSEGDVENEERTAKINAHLQSLFGDQFQMIPVAVVFPTIMATFRMTKALSLALSLHPMHRTCLTLQ